jgi:hypothetical protein
MRMPEFTAEAALGQSTTRYTATAAHTATGPGGELHPALIALPTNGFPPSPFCKTSACVTLGKCRTRVQCCSKGGRCSCSTLPC